MNAARRARRTRLDQRARRGTLRSAPRGVLVDGGPSEGAAPQSVEEYVATLPEDEREVAEHVLLGGFNKYGRPVGFHHAPHGVAPPGRRVVKVLKRHPDGSYSAIVSFWDPQRRRWVRKDSRHTMFPDHWTRDEVMTAGREAYRARVDRVAERWTGSSGRVPIGGYLRPDSRGPATFFRELDR